MLNISTLTTFHNERFPNTVFWNWNCTSLKMFETIRTGGKKDEKIINVQDGISPYRTEKQSKINKWYMYLYSRLKSKTFSCSLDNCFVVSRNWDVHICSVTTFLDNFLPNFFLWLVWEIVLLSQKKLVLVTLQVKVGN